MTSYNDPSFRDRVGQSADAKRKALDQLRLKPQPDDETFATRKAAVARREAAQAEKSIAKRAATEVAEQAKAKAAMPAPTEAERKAARDARYAARKGRR